ncbi:hypothetical protein SAMN02744040_00082 [Tepidibacter thalassicus DSM 15285]|jgi:hypothetical protein|uniref:Uncharacterized protein n=2 Tax=Tepidibacter TaxID=214904 RepID=A0A1M5NJQ0_9FIRM|nr:hypothetical protein [Tepidibacter formicigenes]SHG89824.1 hypothetical protein SAMN02744040_00082 [Tepidibacter thalassicus DSM 15285]SHJ75044.1 hypothetical protein SAMN02744037_00744 [Tepidibacter formicigenes DSM 15518]
MTNKELKEAMMSEESIIFDGAEYKCISAIIYRKSGNKIKIRAELMDKNAHSVIIVNPDKVERKHIQT